MSDKFPALPDIPPDPKIQLETWRLHDIALKDQTYYVQVRRAFVQNLITNYPLGSAREVQEAVRRRFGAKPSHSITLSDLRELQAVRVPMPGGGFRYKLASQIGDVNIMDEWDERVRIDLLSINRTNEVVFMEVNRGTTTAFVQLLNLMIDDGQQPYIYGVTTDNDKWVVIHFEDGNRARNFEDWMAPKIY